MFVLDTNTLIYLFQGRGNVKHHLLQRSLQEMAIPAVVLYALKVGIAKSAAAARRRQQLDRLGEVVATLPFDKTTASRAAQIRVALERQGMLIGPIDSLIAATTIAHNGILVTHNRAEFSRVPELRWTDWF